MKKLITDCHLSKLLALFTCGAVSISVAQATSYSLNFDSDPSSAVKAYGSGDTGALGNMAGVWFTTNGSPNEIGIGDPTTNGYWAITQTTPTVDGYTKHGMKSEMVIANIDPGYALSGFTFNCDVRIGGGNPSPADGIAISFANAGDSSTNSASEQGTSTGLAVSLLSWPGDSTSGQPGLQIKYNGVTVTNVALTTLNGACGDTTSVQTGPTDLSQSTTASLLVAGLCWQPLVINWNAGLVSVSYKGVTLVSNLPIPVQALPGGTFVVSGRTGGSWQEADIDNISITTIPSTTPVVSATTGSLNGWYFNINDSGLATPNTNTLTVTVDGVLASPKIVQSGNVGAGDGSGLTTVSYASPSPLFYTLTWHTNVITFSGTGFTGAVKVTNAFFIARQIASQDRVAGYSAVFYGESRFSANGGGRTGSAGDYALLVGITNSGSSAAICSDPFLMNILNAGLAAADTASVSFWMKRLVVGDGGGTSDTWWFSPSAPDGQGRGLNLHFPYYSGGAGSTTEPCYFDIGNHTSGSGRINGGLAAGPGGSDFDGTTNYWRNAWRHVAIVKNGGARSIWLDGQQIAILTQASGCPAFDTDMTKISIGSALTYPAAAPSLSLAGWIDDYAIYTNTLSSVDIAALYAGGAPNTVSIASSMIAWWDFNDPPSINLAKSGTNMVVTFKQVLQSATNVAGPFTDIYTTSPYTNSSGSPAMFFRTRE